MHKKDQPIPDLTLVFIILSLMLEAILVLKNQDLKQVYWEQELLAIKQAYQSTEGGIRSKRMKSATLRHSSLANANTTKAAIVLAGSCGLSRKQEKQMILRKLQFDLVRTYSCWCLGLMMLKIMLALSCLFANWSFDKMAALPMKELPKAILKQLSDNALISVILVSRALEVVNFCFIYRWLSNIKVDILKFIRLLKSKKQD